MESGKRQFVLSTHLTVVYGRNDGPIIVHRNKGVMVRATPELIKFLELFRCPLTVEEIKLDYDIPDLDCKIKQLTESGFLLHSLYDEEKDILERSIAIADWQITHSKYFIIYHPRHVKYPLPHFSALMDKAYLFLLSNGFKRLHKKPFVFICNTKKEFRKFWGNALLPPRVSFYVAIGRILVIRPHKIYELDFSSEIAFKAMVHEVVHIFLCQHYTNLPVWAIEGLCEYYSACDYQLSFEKLLCLKKPYRFNDIEHMVTHSILDIDGSPIEFNMAYRQSLSFILFLARSFGEKKLMQCIFNTGLSKNFNLSFKEHFSKTIETCELDWQKSFT